MYGTDICIIMFQVGKPVTGNDFIGREKEILEIAEYLKLGQSIVLIAPRRFGKTSLVLEVLKKLEKQKYYTSFVDVFANATLSGLSQEITAEVLKNHGLKDKFQKMKNDAVAMLTSIEFKSAIEDFEYIVGFSGNTPYSDMELLKRSLAFINDFPAKHNKKITFAFDEFGDILKFDNNQNIIKLIRAIIQKQPNAAYIFSGSYESVMDSMFVNSKSPFYRMAKVINLGYLEFSDVEQYMHAKLSEARVKIDKSLIEHTIDLFKGHPYYCQLALQQIYLFAKLKKSLPTLDDLIEEMLANEKSYLEKLWEDLASNRENVFILKHLTAHRTGIYSMASKKKINASRTLKYLAGRGIIYKDPSGHHFYDPLFELWVGRFIND